MTKPQLTHFGFEEIPAAQKADRVADVFHTVASRYDLMNDLMSLGLHRFWKQYLLSTVTVKSYHQILDIAGGTGDIAKGFLKKLYKTGGHSPTGAVYLADINDSMLKMGRDKLIDQGYYNHLFYIQADAQNLPFQKNYFDIASMGFGLRNVTDKEKALASLYSVIKPGGCLLILEFSHPILPFLKSLYDQYSFSILPKLGQYIAHSEDSYRYLVESIRRHPDQNALKNMILNAGFDLCEYTNLSGGIVCLHKAYKT